MYIYIVTSVVNMFYFIINISLILIRNRKPNDDYSILYFFLNLIILLLDIQTRFDEDQQFKETSRQYVVKLQTGDPKCLSIWKTLCTISRRDFSKVYKRLDVSLSECGESFYNSRITLLINEFQKKD